MSKPKPAQLYHDALWEAGQDALTTTELVMALCYANHAHKAPYDRAWVVDTRLMDHCKIRSTSSVARIRDSLVSKGWLTPLHPDTGEVIAAEEAKGWQRRRKSIVYLLTIPTTPTIKVATSTVEVAAATSVSEVATSMADGTTSMSDAGYFDHRGLPSQNPPDRPSLSSAGPAAPVPAPRTDGNGQDEREELIQWIKERHRPGGRQIEKPRAYLATCEAKGDYPSLVADMHADQAQQANQPPQPPPLPDHCGTCGDLDAPSNPAVRNKNFRYRRDEHGRQAKCHCHPEHPNRTGSTS